MLNISKYFSGMCPSLNENHTIRVNYINCSTLDGPTTYMKTLFNCEYAMQCKNASNCPIYHNAPKQI